MSHLYVVLHPGYGTMAESVCNVSCSTTPGTGEIPKNWTNDHSVVVLQHMGGVEGTGFAVLLAQDAPFFFFLLNVERLWNGKRFVAVRRFPLLVSIPLMIGLHQVDVLWWWLTVGFQWCRCGTVKRFFLFREHRWMGRKSEVLKSRGRR